MPPGLDIERAQNLNGTMPAYAEHVLISTGKADWASRIEEDADGEFTRQLRSYIGPRGKYSNPFYNVALTHSSFPTPSAANTASAYLFPSFRYVPSISLDPTSVDTFVKAFVLPSIAVTRGDIQPTKEPILRQPELQTKFPGSRGVHEIVILICSHNTRDSRCGILGPLLQDEFKEKLQSCGIPVIGESDTDAHVLTSGRISARVGLISHIGGHKWAGNTIIYMPPELRDNSLAGTGVWYGRVGPEHVEGIVQQTILGGTIIGDLFRGALNTNREVIRL